ncbi:MAG TPA: GIY-YIG nuclease family protein [Savagea sp.]
MITVEPRAFDVILKRENSEELHGFANVQGVSREKGGLVLYFDMNGQCMFVGKARKMRQRIKKHLQDQGSPLTPYRKEISTIKIYYIDSPVEREMLETYFINHERAKYNYDKAFFKEA